MCLLILWIFFSYTLLLVSYFLSSFGFSLVAFLWLSRTISKQDGGTWQGTSFTGQTGSYPSSRGAVFAVRQHRVREAAGYGGPFRGQS